jgi:hypothetical protein
MSFSTKECAWAQTTLKILGRTITGVRAFEFTKAVEKEHLFAAGADPIDIQEGNKTPTGSITLLKYELDMMNEAAVIAGYADITEVPHTLISATCTYKKTATSQAKSISALGMAFSSMGAGMQQNAKMTEVPLPFLAMKMVFA